MDAIKKEKNIKAVLEPAKPKASGMALAAILSGSIGCFIIGLAIILAVISGDINNFLNWWNPVGPLSGKTGVGIIAWLLSWLLLHFAWKDKEINYNLVLAISYVLLILAFIFSFPPFFQMFEH